MTQKDESFSVFLKEIAMYKNLSKEQELELGKLAANGDKKARTILINTNLRYVVSEAKKFTGRGFSLKELVSFGYEGLVQAVDHYNPAFNTKLITSASYWIFQAINRALQAQDTKSISLDAFIDDTDECTLSNFVYDEQNESPEDYAEKQLTKAHITRLLEKLNPVEKDIIINHYGLYGKKPCSFSQIGDKYKKTKAWANLVEKAAIKKLQQAIAA